MHSLTLPGQSVQPLDRLLDSTAEEFQVPIGAQNPAIWNAALRVMAERPQTDTAAFLHCDSLPVNMLWSREKITGLTDWSGIHRGSRAIDIGHCRRYLAALYSPDWSEQLWSLHESIAGVELDPWWDLYALLHYDDGHAKAIGIQVAGRRAVDAAGMPSRVEILIERALRRLA